MKCLLSLKQDQHGAGETVKFHWDPTGRYLVSCGANRRVHIWTRGGNKVHEIALRGSGSCLDIQWDRDGETVAILQEKHPEVVLYNVHTAEQQILGIGDGMKEPTFMAWSNLGPQLAIGSAKGNLLIYDKQTKTKNPVWGKHSKAIICGCWGKRQNILALGSNDNTFTISNEKGETEEQLKVRAKPIRAIFASIHTSSLSSKSDFLVLNIEGKTLYVYNWETRARQMELKFKKSYGDLCRLETYGNSFIFVGFKNGKVVSLSTDEKEVGEEVQNWGALETPLTTFSSTHSLNRLATVMGPTVHLVDLQDIYRWNEEEKDKIEFGYELGRPAEVAWTSDGQILTVSTDDGCVLSYLSSIPVLSATNGIFVAYLQSLQSVKVISVADQKQHIEVPLKIEPSFLAVGPNCIAAGMNNHVWFYSASVHSDNKPMLIYEKEYLGTVNAIYINHTHVAVLSQGKVFVDNLAAAVSSAGGDRKAPSKVLPEDNGAEVTSMRLTDNFVVYSTPNAVHHFYLENEMSCVETTHSDARVSKVYPNPEGTRVLVVDVRGAAYIYNIVNDTRIPVPDFPKSASVVWDLVDEGVFVVVENKVRHCLTTYVYTHDSTSGPTVEKLEPSMKVSESTTITNIYNGNYWGQSASGKIVSAVLGTHSNLNRNIYDMSISDSMALKQALALNRMTAVFEIASRMNDSEVWATLGKKALETLDVDLALRVFTKLGNAAMVISLKRLQKVEDLGLLKGHICTLFKDFEAAQRHFTSSKSRPVTALEMRRDLLQWDQALKLANHLAPDQIPSICREYAQQLEFKGEYQMALQMYQQAVSQTMGGFDDQPSTSHVTDSGGSHLRVCKAGIARMTLRTGHMQRGLALVRQSRDKELIKSCGAILEAMRQYSEAAELYKMANQIEKAAYMYLKTKAMDKLEALMDQITAPKLLAQFAKAMESQRRYKEAAAAYERANDVDNVIRVCLKHLDQPQKAFELARKTNSSNGASMVATYCMSNGDFELAIEFLLVANLDQKAFERAHVHNKMDIYAAALGEKGSEEQYLKVANYYEENKKFALAGHNYARCQRHVKAMRLFLRCGEDEIESAIAVVKAAKDSPDRNMLIRTLHDYLLGESDGKQKDPKYIYMLYMAIGDHKKASKTAVIIAAQEQQIGGYSTAHSLLFDTMRELMNHKAKIPNELRRNLILIHSYVIVRKLVKRQKHKDAARMLIRVCKNISRFPAHIVPILTSCVIECARAGLKKSAYDHAIKLMQPEHRPKIVTKVRKTIEKLVRRPPSKEEEDEVSPCCFCFFKLSNAQLNCPQCKNDLPFCTITGRHMVASDYSNCPECKMPALYSELMELTKENCTCYICKAPIIKEKVRKLERAEVKVAITNFYAGGGAEAEKNKKMKEEIKKSND